MKLVSEKIRRIVDGFFEFSENIVVGVSGGADSMTLLHCLMNSKKELNLVVAHLNHNLRGYESECDERFVRDFCLKNNVEFVCKSLQILSIARAQKISVEMAGRNERYKFFNEFGMTIATAHTLSDKIETFFLNLARGSSLKGICSIPAIRGKIKRPLINFSRFEIESYCIENCLEYRNDSSNSSLKYFRNRVRHKLIPEFKKLNFKFELNMLKIFKLLDENETYFDKIVYNILKTDLISGRLNIARFNIKPAIIQKRIIFEFLKLREIKPTNLMIERILNAIKSQKKNFKVSLPGGKFAICCNNFLVIEFNSRSEIKLFDYVLPKFNDICYGNLHFKKLDLEHYKQFLKKNFNLFIFKLDYDKIKGSVHVRNRLPGDRIKLLKRPTKKLKKLIQESGISVIDRENIVVLSDDLGPFWVSEFGGDVRVLPSVYTKNFLLIFKKIM